MPHLVLIVEDDDQIAAPLVRTLEREGYAVERVAAGLPAVERVRAGDVDLVLLDLGLPDVDGLEVCRRIRANGYLGGVLILTARGGELDRVVGLDVGADDYLAKPFGLAELLARARALLRRSAPAVDAPAAVSAPAPAPAVDHGTSLRIDTGSRRVWVGADELAVTAKEFDVLALLHSSPGAVFTRERVMDEVWDENWFGSTKTLDTTIGRLRQKLEDSGTSSRIVTVRGVGFRLESEPADA
ncbi:response regulator transcription factor [Aeromicrobium fastidiosum]|uniref:Response regulator transcription factor n=1 Tax=Aeromicrobium fastidiosum TaxID=52699 RepID=A0A641ARM9_9ACTN|nr:response regulator transcription factor [Aeromicrobium fastidiosum]KAA1379863.1 response regulator transcription factor [Aeromicrobium fastidiosum]MBP2389364.1 DNA-binding response OmpR family regulator [Aeromicrobium fastidiosum]